MSVSAVHVTLQSDHGYIPLVAVGAGLVSTWAGFKVGKARRKFGILYPQMYAEKDEKNAVAFNCIQRAHQNTLEQLPLFYTLLFTASVFRPKLAAAAGLVRIAGFIVYIKGYSTGDPKKRMRGSFGWLGLFALVGLTIESSALLICSNK